MSSEWRNTRHLKFCILIFYKHYTFDIIMHSTPHTGRSLIDCLCAIVWVGHSECIGVHKKAR